MGGQSLLICVSVSHGNTATIARAMAEVLGADVREPEQVDPADLSGYDLVGFGSGIFMCSHHPTLRRYVEALPKVDGPRAFVFTTSGMGRSQRLPWQPSIAAMLRAKGFAVGGTFSCRGYDTWRPLRIVGGINRGHPDAADVARARAFAQRLAGEGGAAVTGSAGPERRGHGAYA